MVSRVIATNQVQGATLFEATGGFATNQKLLEDKQNTDMALSRLELETFSVLD